MRVTLDGVLAFVACRGGARARGNAVAHQSRHGKRSQVLHIRRQIAEAFAEEERRREGAERFGADALRSAVSDIPVYARGQDRLVLVALIELVLDAGGEIVEPALRVAAVRREPLVSRAET